MKWIKYKIVQNVIDGENIYLEKKVGYNEANLAIAETEAYNAEYTIEEDNAEEPNIVTLEDVVAMIGDIGTILDEINGEVV